MGWDGRTGWIRVNPCKKMDINNYNEERSRKKEGSKKKKGEKNEW